MWYHILKYQCEHSKWEDAYMEEKKLGMTWLKIYTVLFVIKILGTTWSEIGALASSANNNLFGNSTVMLILVVGAVELVFDIVAFIFFYKKTELGYYLNIAFMVLSVLFAVMAQVVTEAYPIGSIMLAGAFLLLIWALPNYIYFKHRKFLFTNKVEKPVSATTKDSAAAITSVAIKEEKAEVAENEKQKQGIPTDSLRKLRELYDAGIITEKEFSEKKKKLLNI